MDGQLKKGDIAERLFTRPEGATMAEVIAATGGPQYNKLKQLGARGYVIRKAKDGRANETRYFATAPAEPTYAATVTGKGQVTIPRPVREHLRLRSGQKLEFSIARDGRVVLQPASPRLSDLARLLPRPKRHLTLEDIDKAIRDAAVARYLRAVGGKLR
jgi:AbrB family looped-hinge helix DNA binding protein